MKIDIEGSEYEILEDILMSESLLTGLVIEFHDCHKYCDKIADFISRFTLPLVHIHSNKYAPLEESETAVVLEMTFSEPKIKRVNLEIWSTHVLDQKNCNDRDEVELIFEPKINHQSDILRCGTGV